MPSEIDLLRSLDDEPLTPSTVDVRRAMTAGRRRRRLRRVAGYTSAAAVTALAVAGASLAAGGLRTTTTTPQAGATGASKTTAAPGAPTSCTLERLPIPDNAPMALVSGADPTGQYLVGRSYPKGGGYQAVIWHDGQATKVMLPGDIEESLRDVNSSGTAVGWSYEGKGEDIYQVPYVYRDGKVSKLPGVAQGSANAINDAGAIVGEDGAISPGKSFGAPLLWPSATAKPTRLPIPAGGSSATANDIDEDGTVVGSIDLKRPYVWFADGTHRELPMPTLDGKPAAAARVFSIQNGWAIGVADADSAAASGGKSAAEGAKDKAKGADSRAVRWNVRTGEVRVFDELGVPPDAVNAQGWQVGLDKQGRAVLVTDTTTVLLPELASHKPGTLSNLPNTLSDDGRIIGGQSDDKADVIQAVVWRCQ